MVYLVIQSSYDEENEKERESKHVKVQLKIFLQSPHSTLYDEKHFAWSFFEK